MYQFLARPDAFLGISGDLRCTLVEHRITGVPPFMRGLRALFLSDIHVMPQTPQSAIEGLVARMKAVRADVVLLGGDYADLPEPAQRWLAAMRGFCAPLGVYAAVGNNDREAFPDVAVLRRRMEDAGIRLLLNESHTVKLRGGRLIVAGVDEYRRGAPEAHGLYPKKSRPDCFRLLISHYPREIDPMPDLMLSGHTHGGQFNFLGITPYAIGFERILHRDRAPRFIAGLHACRGGRIFVSKGLGASRIPLRAGVRPEMDLLLF